MKKHNEKRSRKIRNLVAFCSLCAILLSVSTYAWFIGMTKVSVNSFEINVATTEGLFLSMDGVNWSYELDAQNTPAYANNANTWANTEGNMGLIPMSTVGDMDSTASRMKIFEKASLSAVPGGYRLLASRVDNYTVARKNAIGEYEEGKGYIAFDLFVKNLSGDAYYPDNKVANEEAIYLTTNSKVVVDAAGGGKDNSGIENSVRVAFVQLGRVNAQTTTASTITGITCKDVMDGATKVVTGICRNAQIWEPNDTLHVKNAINWYDKSCLERDNTGTDVNNVNEEKSYKTAGACGTVQNGEAYSTYAVSRDLDIEDYVNVYDGPAYNKYTKNYVTYATYAGQEDEGVKATYKLVDFPYFTDTQKDYPGNTRPEFMTLAPNSITKLRVYVYIEGQDIDNYDFAQLGKHIAINFGFTKERYEETDFPQYNGPDTDITPVGTATVAQ